MKVVPMLILVQGIVSLSFSMEQNKNASLLIEKVFEEQWMNSSMTCQKKFKQILQQTLFLQRSKIIYNHLQLVGWPQAGWGWFLLRSAENYHTQEILTPISEEAKTFLLNSWNEINQYIGKEEQEISLLWRSFRQTLFNTSSFDNCDEEEFKIKLAEANLNFVQSLKKNCQLIEKEIT